MHKNLLACFDRETGKGDFLSPVKHNDPAHQAVSIFSIQILRLVRLVLTKVVSYAELVQLTASS